MARARLGEKEPVGKKEKKKNLIVPLTINAAQVKFLWLEMSKLNMILLGNRTFNAL